jgi:surface protein
MSEMFEGAESFNQDITGWDVSSVFNMQSLFNGAKSFNQDISIWNIASAVTMNYMFKGAESFNIDISNWDVTNVSFMNGMFNGALTFKQDLSPWKEDSFPYDFATDIFKDSGCDVKTSPESDDSTFCATPLPTPSPTQYVNAIPSWALLFDSFRTNFTKGSESEITLNYKIGNGRDNNVKLFAKGCDDEITGAIVTHSKSITSIENEPSLQQLQVLVDVDKKSIAVDESNIWNSDVGAIELCVMVQLTSETTGVIKELQRNIGIDFNFEVAFTAESPVQLDQIYLENEETTADVEDYILACTCGGILEDCNTNILGVKDFLNICIRSRDPEMKIDYLQSLQMVQEQQDGNDNTFLIVKENALGDTSISAKSKSGDESEVHVATIIPNDFFSYESTSAAKISGVVFLKLAESRRRLAVDMTGNPNINSQANRALQARGDQESRFAIEVELQKNELELGSAANNAFGSMVSGVIVVAVSAVAAATMW